MNSYRIPVISGLLLLSWMILSQGCLRFRISDGKAIENFKQRNITLQTGTLLFEGRNIHYAYTGNDSLPTLFLIHGTPGSWTAFEDYLKDTALLKVCRVVSIDRPGFGYSDFGRPMNLAEQSRYLLPLVDSLQNGQPFYLAGHSLGGPLVVKMAADRPTVFSGILLISGSIDPALEPKEKWRSFMALFPFRYLLPGAFRPSNTELIWFKKDVVSLSADFSKVVCPVFLVHGRKDRWVPPGTVAYGIRKLTGAACIESLMIDEGNHFIPWTHRPAVTKALTDMIGRKP